MASCTLGCRDSLDQILVTPVRSSATLKTKKPAVYAVYAEANSLYPMTTLKAAPPC